MPQRGLFRNISLRYLDAISEVSNLYLFYLYHNKEFLIAKCCFLYNNLVLIDREVLYHSMKKDNNHNAVFPKIQ